MANILSSKKDIKRNNQRRLINQALKNRVRTYRKYVENVFKTADASQDAILATIRKFESVAMRVANSNAISELAVRRTISRLTLRMKAKFGQVANS